MALLLYLPYCHYCKKLPFRASINPNQAVLAYAYAAPCRIFYRVDSGRVFILYVMRAERLFRRGKLKSRDEDRDET